MRWLARIWKARNGCSMREIRADDQERLAFVEILRGGQLPWCR
jgi:hypothetical protein